MVRFVVYEAVGELNERSTLGRAIVNPPERKSKIKPRATKDVWHLCKCGRGFSNNSKYNEHQLEHKNINFKQTWLSPRIKSPNESSNNKEELSSDSSGPHVLIPPKRPKSPIAKIARTTIRSRVSLENNVSNKRLRSSTGNADKEDEKRTRLENHVVNEEEKRVKKSQGIHRRQKQKVVHIAKEEEEIESKPNNKATRRSDVFYDAVGTRTRSKNNDLPESPAPSIVAPTKGPQEILQPAVKEDNPVKIMDETEIDITAGQLKLFFDCEKCGLPFKTARGLSQHDKWYHAQPPVEIICKICPAKFTTETELQKHMVNHSIKLMYKKYKFGSSSIGPVSVSARTPHRNGLKNDVPVVVNDNKNNKPMKNNVPTMVNDNNNNKSTKNNVPAVVNDNNNNNKSMKTHSNRINGKGDKCGYCGQLFYDRKVLWPHLTECRGTLNN